MKQIKYLLAAIILVVLDSIYLRLIKNYFAYQIKVVQNAPAQINYVSAILCYVFLIFGLNYFIIKENKSVNDAFLLGITIYAVYELTTKALLNNWSWLTVIIDTMWGATLFALTTFIVYSITN